MTKLQYLNLNSCTQLEFLPRHTTNQASLSKLSIYGTRLRELPSNIGQLSKLREMEISPDEGCFQMQSLPDSMGSLTLLERLVLKILHVQSLPDSMGNLTLLEQLVLNNVQVQSLPKSLKQLINLQTLEIRECTISELDIGQGPFTSSLSNLKEISLSTTRVSKISISDDCCPGLTTIYIHDNDHLTDIDTLPTAMERISVIGCKLLRNISCIGGVINLQKLSVLECPELDTLPSFDELASLKDFALMYGNKVVTIHGLHHCTSLERFDIHGKCWEVSGIETWEHVQRLRTLHLMAKKRSAVERCIQTIQKWPDSVIICTEAVAGAGSLLNSSAFPNLSVVHSFANKKFSYNEKIKFDLLNGSSDGNAMMLCFVINCDSRGMHLSAYGHSWRWWWGELVDAAKWTFIAVFTARVLDSAWELHTREGFHTALELHIDGFRNEGESEMEVGMVVRGEEEIVVEGFHRLLQLLAS